MPKGQTLLEVIISAAIIITGIVSLVTLIVYIQSSSRLTYQEAIAIGLAQEGIEAARFVRDGNWLEREAGVGTDVYDGLYDSATLDYTAIYRWRPTSGTPITFDFTPDTASAATTAVYITSSNQYRQTTGTVPGGWVATPYTRYVTMYPICSADGGVTLSFLTADGQDCASAYVGTKQIGIQVQVTVAWQNGGETISRVAIEDLYNWKYAE